MYFNKLFSRENATSDLFFSYFLWNNFYLNIRFTYASLKKIFHLSPFFRSYLKRWKLLLIFYLTEIFKIVTFTFHSTIRK